MRLSFERPVASPAPRFSSIPKPVSRPVVPVDRMERPAVSRPAEPQGRHSGQVAPSELWGHGPRLRGGVREALRTSPSAFKAVENYLRAAPSAAGERFLRELQGALATRPHAATVLSGFLEEATRVQDPAGYLADVSVLSGLSELSDEALHQLGKKAASGQVDPGWLLDSRLDLDAIDFMGRDAHTPWFALRRASELPEAKRQRWASLVLPGIAGEMVAQRVLSEELAPYRVVEQQQRMKGVRADFLIASEDGTLAHPVEVKTWTEARWRSAINAHAKGPSDEAQRKAAEPLTHLIQQLKALTDQTGQSVVLALKEVRPELYERIAQVVTREAPRTLLVSLPAQEISDRLAQLRAAFSGGP